MLELLHRVFDWRVGYTAAQILVVDPINQEAVEVLANTVDDRVMTVLKIHARHVHGTGGQLHQVVNVPTVQREVRDLSRPYCGRHLRVFSIHSCRFAAYFDDFLRLAHLHLEVHVRDGAGIYGHAIVRHRLEARSFHRELVRSDWQLLQAV